MDSTRFEDLLRSFAHGLSRRATLAAALSTIFATGSLALVADDAEGKKKRKKKKKKNKKKPKGCAPGTKICGNACIPSDNCCSDADCDGGGCQNGSCICAAIICGEQCCDADANQVCIMEETGQSCQDGSCPPSDVCNNEDFISLCGPDCLCATSVDDASLCSDFQNAACMECVADSDCQVLGPDAYCIANGPRCEGCETSTVCVIDGCPGSAPRSRRHDGNLRPIKVHSVH